MSNLNFVGKKLKISTFNRKYKVKLCTYWIFFIYFILLSLCKKYQIYWVVL